VPATPRRAAAATLPRSLIKPANRPSKRRTAHSDRAAAADAAAFGVRPAPVTAAFPLFLNRGSAGSVQSSAPGDD